MHKQYSCHTLEELNALSLKILAECDESKIFLFNGNLGAGKTTLIKCLCRDLGYTGEVTSPTFSLINDYQSEGVHIYHMDLYRLKDENEALEIGIEEYLYSGDYCFIEWPQIVIPLIDEDYYMVNIVVEDMQSRKIAIEKC
ncbi:MAG: tRNA (adenosine(37)-N6)-threonylcarbamoyltransferase complex ATPase subunit type 1 TsaE [Saprospiraceae bacterium]|nr:tRNA (adenosine(37)-N6)-threonylcarbamoyltransferase complex ATPase subunit type 1 TsaE [Saprospiraceae bacterium]